MTLHTHIKKEQRNLPTPGRNHRDPITTSKTRALNRYLCENSNGFLLFYNVDNVVNFLGFCYKLI